MKEQLLEILNEYFAETSELKDGRLIINGDLVAFAKWLNISTPS